MIFDYSFDQILISSAILLFSFLACVFIAVKYAVNIKKAVCHALGFSGMIGLILFAQHSIDSMFPNSTMVIVCKLGLVLADIACYLIWVTNDRDVKGDTVKSFLFVAFLVPQTLTLGYLGNLSAVHQRDIAINENSVKIDGKNVELERLTEQLNIERALLKAETDRLMEMAEHGYVKKGGAQDVKDNVDALKIKVDMLYAEQSKINAEITELKLTQPETLVEQYGERGAYIIDKLSYTITLTFFIISFAFGTCAKRFGRTGTESNRDKPRDSGSNQDQIKTDSLEQIDPIQPNKSLMNRLVRKQEKNKRKVEKAELNTKYEQMIGDDDIKSELKANNINTHRPALKLKREMGWTQSDTYIKNLVNEMNASEPHEGIYIPEAAR